MANPYPGMNPYLENPIDWPTVHVGMIHNLWAQLSRSLPSGYRARIEERIYVEELERQFRSDVNVVEDPQIWSSATRGAMVADEPVIIMISEARERYLNIVNTTDEMRLVTSIEILSPGNKRAGSGNKEYRDKQQFLLKSDSNLLEIDLLRDGLHTVAVSPSVIRTDFDYIACLHRAHAWRFEVWPVGIRERLPRVRVPLDKGNPDVVIDINLALNRLYEEGFQEGQLPYDRDPTPPLSAEDAAWSDALLRAAGLRS